MTMLAAAHGGVLPAPAPARRRSTARAAAEMCYGRRVSIRRHTYSTWTSAVACSVAAAIALGCGHGGGARKQRPTVGVGRREDERFLELVRREVWKNWSIPPALLERGKDELAGTSATVVLFIEADGRLARWEFASRSGGPDFDDSIDRMLRLVWLPAPPASLRKVYETSGLVVSFRP